MKKILLFAVLLSLYSSIQAQNTTSLLWKVSGNGLEQPSYLFGTIHLICSKDFRTSDSLLSKLTESQQLILELDMDDPTMMLIMQQNMFMKNGQKIQELLNEKEVRVIDNYFKDSLGMNIAIFANAKPFILMSLMYSKLLGCTPESYELFLTQRAEQQKKEILGLETVSEQMAIFDSIPYQLQAKMLLDIIRDAPKAQVEFRKMVELYQKQDVEGLLKMTDSSQFDFSAYESILLNDRNKRWIAKIERYIKLKPSFIAVGAAHLGGERGILSLLRKQGYTIDAIKN